MDLKNKYSSNSQGPTHIKSTHLINPLLTIANASTPVRTRIIKPSSQLNSTPVNPNKLGIPVKPPATNNKENEDSNLRNSRRSFFGDKNSNQSPVMAFNRNQSDILKPESRSLTPKNFRRQEPFSNLDDYGVPIESKN